jgi:hypothetical protein
VLDQAQQGLAVPALTPSQQQQQQQWRQQHLLLLLLLGVC